MFIAAALHQYKCTQLNLFYIVNDDIYIVIYSDNENDVMTIYTYLIKYLLVLKYDPVNQQSKV